MACEPKGKSARRRPIHPMGEYIKAARLACGMSQVELADRLGVKRERVSNWECAENNPQIELIPMIAHELLCTVDTLFGVTAPKMSPAQFRLHELIDQLDDHDQATLLVAAEAMMQRHRSDG